MKKHKKLRKVMIWCVVILAIVGAVAFSVLRRQQPSYTEETARTQDIVTYYTFSGNVEPDSAKTVSAAMRGTVKTLFFAEGDEVKEEDEVLRPKSGSKYEAPMDGTISDIYVKEDEDFLPGDPMFRVADYAHPIVKIKVDEYDVSALSKGMRVSVKLQATGKTVEGEIARIAQEATVQNDIAYYEVKITLPQDGSLVMGLTCEVTVPRQSVLNATTVSMNAIQYDDNNEPFVYCYARGGEITTQDVALGISNGTIVEIKSGIKSGETVLLPEDKSMMAMYPMMRRN